MAIGICDRRCLGNKLPRTPTTRRHQTKSWNCQLLTHLLTTGSIDSPTHPVLLQQNIWTCTWMSNPPNPSNDSRNYPLWDQRISKVILVYSFISNHQKNPDTKATRELSLSWKIKYVIPQWTEVCDAAQVTKQQTPPKLCSLGETNFALSCSELLLDPCVNISHFQYSHLCKYIISIV